MDKLYIFQVPSRFLNILLESQLGFEEVIKKITKTLQGLIQHNTSLTVSFVLGLLQVL